jgi:uncharacterized protein (DUF2141 family)
MKIRLLTLILFFAVCENGNAILFSIAIDEMRCSKGNIIVSVYTNENCFEENKPVKNLIFSKQKHLKNGKFKCTIELTNGNYGIAILDDENADGKMNYKFIGVPKEGYGFSKFDHTGLRHPKYSDFEFTLNENTGNLKIKLRYL